MDGAEMCGFNDAVITALLQTLPKYFECRRLKLPEHLQALGVKKNKANGADGRTTGVKRTEAMRASEAGAAGVGAEGAVTAAATVFPEQVAKRARSADTVTTVAASIVNPPSLAAMAALDSTGAGSVAAVVPLPPPPVVDSPAATASPLHLEATMGPLMATASLQNVAQPRDRQQDVSGIPEAQMQ